MVSLLLCLDALLVFVFPVLVDGGGHSAPAECSLDDNL